MTNEPQTESLASIVEAMTEPEKEAFRATARHHMLSLWVKEHPAKVPSVVKMMKERHRTFGEVATAIATGEYDWIFMRPQFTHGTTT